MSEEPRWWVGINDRPVGPWTAEEIATAIKERRVTLESLVCPVGGDQWVPLKQVQQLTTSQAISPSVSSQAVPPLAESVVNPYSPPTTATSVSALADWHWPSMQTLVTTYCLYVMPLYQAYRLIEMLLQGTGIDKNDPSYWMFLVLHFVQFPMSVTLFIMFLVAGLRWRSLDATAPQLTRRAIFVGLTWIVVCLLVLVCCMPYVDALTVDVNDTPIGFWTSFLLFVLALLIAWEVWILIWLYRYEGKLFSPTLTEHAI
jgi:hypothetical protein